MEQTMPKIVAYNDLYMYKVSVTLPENDLSIFHIFSILKTINCIVLRMMT